MARNKYVAKCCYCKNPVPAGAGYLERSATGTWTTIHADCAVKRREEKKAQNGIHKRL